MRRAHSSNEGKSQVRLTEKLSCLNNMEAAVLLVTWKWLLRARGQIHKCLVSRKWAAFTEPWPRPHPTPQKWLQRQALSQTPWPGSLWPGGPPHWNTWRRNTTEAHTPTDLRINLATKPNCLLHSPKVQKTSEDSPLRRSSLHEFYSKRIVSPIHRYQKALKWICKHGDNVGEQLHFVWPLCCGPLPESTFITYINTFNGTGLPKLVPATGGSLWLEHFPEHVTAQMNLLPRFKAKAALNIEMNLSPAYK